MTTAARRQILKDAARIVTARDARDAQDAAEYRAEQRAARTAGPDLRGWTVEKVDPREFGGRGPVQWVTCEPGTMEYPGAATDAYPTKRAAVAAVLAMFAEGR